MKKISKPVAVVVAVSACAIIGIGAVCAAKNAHEAANSEPTMVTEEVSTPEVATPEIAVEETDAVEADAGDESESQDVMFPKRVKRPKAKRRRYPKRQAKSRQRASLWRFQKKLQKQSPNLRQSRSPTPSRWWKKRLSLSPSLSRKAAHLLHR